jgi:hypothetical protein
LLAFAEGKLRLDYNQTMQYSWKEVTEVAQKEDLIKKGGVWKPKHCEARKRFLIVIPYRDREAHLKAFLAHMHPILQRQLLSYRIMVVEQVGISIFKGVVINNPRGQAGGMGQN